MIKYLEDLPGKKKKVVADLGCGFAEINQHFKDNSRFEFHNLDHHSSSEFVVSIDIKNTELDDYSVDVSILSLAMWGSNCKDYLEEAHRILDTGGTLLIAEAYTRWNKELDEQGKPINRLVNLLEENNFTIIKNDEQKFMFIECRKK
jgi:ubiquinone/menaquinone biosynthesis C-methylase UbiE